MFRTLLKKQFLELNASYFRNRKTGKSRSKAGIAALCVLYAFVFLMVAFLFFGLSMSMGLALFPLGYDWLFFCMMSLIAVLLGTFGSIFNTYAGLYNAKDNDFLFSLPIRPSQILAARLVSVYALGLFYELLVMIPSCVAYAILVGFTPASLICTLLSVILLGFPILALTCLLGWVVALIAAKLKNKSFLTVIVSLAFLAVYYMFIYRMDDFLAGFLSFAENVGSTIQSNARIVYWIGKGFVGDPLGFLMFASFCLVCLIVTFLVLSRTFLRLATANVGEKKKAYVKRDAKSRSPLASLFGKECKRFFSSSTYMLNCGLVLVMAPLAAFALIYKSDVLNEVIMSLGEVVPIRSILPVAGVALACLILSLNVISAPSVSLEGKSIWILQSLPVNPMQVLTAKIGLHCVFTFPAAIILCVPLAVVFGMDVIAAALMLIVCFAYVLLSAVFGLVVNLLRPNLSWTNETYPIKQSMSVFLTMFGGWIVSVAVAVPYFFMTGWMDCRLYLAILLVVFCMVDVLLIRWLSRKGSEIFAHLS